MWLAELDRLADGVDSLEGLVCRLFVEERFTGSLAGYYDPRNPLLHEVLARRLGIPITLAVICIEVGRRAGVPLEGVGMPGYFLVRPVGTECYLNGALCGGPRHMCHGSSTHKARLVDAYHRDRAGGLAQDLVGAVAEERALADRPAAAGQHDEVGAPA